MAPTKPSISTSTKISTPLKPIFAGVIKSSTMPLGLRGGAPGKGNAKGKAKGKTGLGKGKGPAPAGVPGGPRLPAPSNAAANGGESSNTGSKTIAAAAAAAAEGNKTTKTTTTPENAKLNQKKRARSPTPPANEVDPSEQVEGRQTRRSGLRSNPKRSRRAMSAERSSEPAAATRASRTKSAAPVKDGSAPTDSVIVVTKSQQKETGKEGTLSIPSSRAQRNRRNNSTKKNEDVNENDDDLPQDIDMPDPEMHELDSQFPANPYDNDNTPAGQPVTSNRSAATSSDPTTKFKSMIEGLAPSYRRAFAAHQKHQRKERIVRQQDRVIRPYARTGRLLASMGRVMGACRDLRKMSDRKTSGKQTREERPDIEPGNEEGSSDEHGNDELTDDGRSDDELAGGDT